MSDKRAFGSACERMIREIESDYRCTADATGRRRRLDPRVVEALRAVPRHEFVPEEMVDQAYHNHPLPIGHGQTISQPYIVALMTDLLNLESKFTVLEVGTGSGYQSAVLSQLVSKVYSVEIVASLSRQAEERLRRLGYDNITLKAADAYHGWPEHAPFDAIIVTAAAAYIPPPLIDQLRPGGRMVIPVGAHSIAQDLLLIEKLESGEHTIEPILPVAFVPLTRK